MRLRPLAALAAVAALTTLACAAAPEEETEAAEDEINASGLRVMSFNIKNGEVVGHDLGKLADSIRPNAPDVLALQEVDEGTRRSGGLHETEALSELLEMPHRFFGASFPFDGGEYGLAILSKYPLSNTRVVRLDDHRERRNGFEPRIAVAADVTVAGKKITVVSVHASTKGEERALNGARIVEALGSRASRAIVMGDFNETPGNAIGDALRDAGMRDAYHEKHPRPWSGFTIPVKVPLRRIDFIFRGRDLGATRHAWVPNVRTSDHRPVAAVIPLPP